MSSIESGQPTRLPSARPLKIGVVAPPWFEVPPVGYGGTEAVIAGIVDGLVALGHEVTLVAAGRSRTRATRFVSTYEPPPSELLGASGLPEVVIAAQAALTFAELDLDIVHDHSLAGPLLAIARTIPTVSTVHGPVTPENSAYYERLGSSVDLVAISQAQLIGAPQLNWVGMVHNAIDVTSFPFAAHTDGSLLWIGRFSPHKGAHLAIEAARSTGRSLILAGKLNEAEERDYFDARVRPKLGKTVEYVGEADTRLKRELYAGSSCLLFPIEWDEPFGMVMIEAMACGTPVVAIRRGSVPEIVEHGRTGIIVDHSSELPSAIEAAVQLDRIECRNWVKERFDLPVMVASYERIYRSLVERSESSIRRLSRGPRARLALPVKGTAQKAQREGF